MAATTTTNNSPMAYLLGVPLLLLSFPSRNGGLQLAMYAPLSIACSLPTGRCRNSVKRLSAAVAAAVASRADLRFCSTSDTPPAEHDPKQKEQQDRAKHASDEARAVCLVHPIAGDPAGDQA